MPSSLKATRSKSSFGVPPPPRRAPPRSSKESEVDKLHVDVVGTLPTDDSAFDIGRLIIVANRPGISEAAVMHNVVGHRVDETDTCCASADADGRKLFETDGAKEPPLLYKLEDRVISGIISLKAECKIAKVVLAANVARCMFATTNRTCTCT